MANKTAAIIDTAQSEVDREDYLFMAECYDALEEAKQNERMLKMELKNARVKLENWKTGKLENWKTGKLENWKTGKLENWKTGKLENWKTGKLAVLRDNGVWCDDDYDAAQELIVRLDLSLSQVWAKYDRLMYGQ